jgi:hypothetical protein
MAACALDAKMPNIRGISRVKTTRLLIFLFISLFLSVYQVSLAVIGVFAKYF